MGSRKDLIKRSLGITEYPWSSDDELDPVSAVEDVADHRSTEPQDGSVDSRRSDSPGTSAVPPAQPAQQQPSHQTPQHNPPSQYHQHHQQPQMHQQQHQSPYSRRNQARDRDLFWSIINSPPRRLPAHGSRSRSSEIPVSYVSRVNHIPAPELRERTSERPLTADFQRILAFKRLTRNFNSMRHHRGHIAGVIPVTRVNPGVIVPSESNSSIRINRQLPDMLRRRYVRATPMGPLPPRNGNSNHAESVRHPYPHPHPHPHPHPYPHPYPGAAPARRRHDSPEAERVRPAQPAPSPDDELNNNPIPLPPVDADASLLDEANVDQDVPLEGEHETEANNNSGASVALEEEIVAIDMESGGGDATVPDGGAGATDRLYGCFPVLDPNVPSTSEGITDPDGPTPVVHGVKRKRRDSEDHGDLETICTVKEFNLNLLRLLECPVCLEWMEPPMSQCRRGHLVCGRCRARLASCPVCRTTFSSVRNRAMEGVAEMLRYPCRHGCGREVRLRRRAPHEASCVARNYQCPAPLCADSPPLPRAQLAQHFQSRHLTMMKIGRRHKFSLQVNTEQHDNWLIQALEEYFHLRIDVDIRTWGVVLYVSYIGPKCDAKNYTYEVSIDGQHNQRKLVYARTTHSDLESSSVNVSRQDCFHLTLDQAINFIRFKNRHSEADKFLDFNVEIAKVEPAGMDDSDS